MSVDVDMMVSDLIASATGDQEKKIAFMLGYSFGMAAALRIIYGRHGCSIAEPLLKHYTTTQEKQRAFTLGYILGDINALIQVLSRLTPESRGSIVLAGEPDDGEEDEEDDNDFTDSIKRHGRDMFA